MGFNPDAGKQDFFLHIARQLVRGVHPNVAARAYLVELGLLKAPPVPKSVDLPSRLRRVLPVKTDKAPSPAFPVSMPSKSASPGSGKGFKVKKHFDMDEDEDLAEHEADAPVFYFDSSGQDTTETVLKTRRISLDQNARPVGEIGIAVHDLLGLSGEPGQKAAEAEASILEAIASDPVRVAADPLFIGKLGCTVPDFVINALSHLIIEEVKKTHGLAVHNLHDVDDSFDETETYKEIYESDDFDWVDND